MAGRPAGPAAGERADPAGEPFGEFLDGVVRQLRRGEFQCEGYSFEAGADGPGGLDPLLFPRRGLRGGGLAGAGGEQGEGLHGVRVVG